MTPHFTFESTCNINKSTVFVIHFSFLRYIIVLFYILLSINIHIRIISVKDDNSYEKSNYFIRYPLDLTINFMASDVDILRGSVNIVSDDKGIKIVIDHQ